MQKLLVAASFATVVLSAVACAPKPTSEQLPPPGLAGAPGAPAAAAPAPGAQGSSTHATPQPSAALTSLPGAGHNVPAPAGGTPESAQLPPGHPPIDTGPTTPGAGAAASAPTGMAPPGMGGGAQEVQITGKVLEAIDVPTYTYMRLQTSAGEEWAAVNTVKVNVGDTVTVNSSLVMENFRSSSLNRTFPKLMMGMLVGSPKR